MFKFAITTLGCKVNQCEEKQILEKFLSSGIFTLVSLKDDADIYIINSCAVTLTAENKAKQIAASIKNRNKNSIIVLAGCYAEKLNEEKIKNFDLYVKQSEKDKIFEICINYLKQNTNKLENNKNNNFLQNTNNNEKNINENKLRISSNRARAMLKIQDGCNNFCSYCIVPYLRKNKYSMPPNEVIESIDKLLNLGYQEIILTGINLGEYSYKDINENNLDIVKLLEILSLYPFGKKFRIRLSSIDPSIVNEKMLLIMKNSKIFVPHFHLSLQSGSDKILKLMNRKYTRSEFIDKVNMIKSLFELPALTTDVIVGFPTETDKDFEETYNLLNDLNFYDFHIFKYSDRPKTYAYNLTPKVEPYIKKKRSLVLHELKREKNLMYYQQNLDQIAEVIPERIYENNTNFINNSDLSYKQLIGHSERYLEVVFEAPSNLIGKITKVKITKINTEQLVVYGKWLNN